MDRNNIDLRKKEEIVGKNVRAEGNQISIGFNRRKLTDLGLCVYHKRT